MSESYDTNYTEEEYGRTYKEHILEIYKIYVEMADRISQRRMNTNVFFVSANTFLFTVISLFSEWSNIILAFVIIIGIVLSIAWYYFLKSYRLLNSGKFKVVYEIEKKLPICPYKLEWENLGKGKERKLYWPLSYLEVVLPILFGIVYFIMLIYLVFITCNIKT